MSNPGDCTAVIMAAGLGSRMMDLTNQCPKPLLPVGRFPLIWYPIKTLEKAGFSDIIIITRQSWHDQIQNALSVDGCPVRARLEYVEIQDTDDWGTADSLRYIADRIKTNVLVVTCDLVSDCDLSELMAVHRKNSSSFTVMLSQLPTTIIADTPVPGFKSKQKSLEAEKISIGFEASNLEHIVFWKAQFDIEDEGESVTFSKKFLDRFPCIRTQSTWTDCHVYMINKFIVKYLQEKKDKNSLQNELLPLVVKKQMSTRFFDSPEEDSEMNSSADRFEQDKNNDLIDFAAMMDNELNSVKYLSLTSCSFGQTEEAPKRNLIRCYAYKQTSGFCIRANTVAAYFEACKQMPRQILKFVTAKKNDAFSNIPESTVIKPKSQVGADCILGECVTIGEKVSIKKSVIGKHCKIGDKVKITNSVIFGHVNIQESCNITNCIIADSANIGDKSELTGCIVGQNQTISTMSKYTNEVVSNMSQMVDNLNNYCWSLH
ncbi:Eukaryotic translation initiation factor 2B, subunit 3 gamma, 58kDa [Bulinus truncatus]|nr:Eukaryotic translation initiation factor 2B, subunit 3 gamma, 58kDa [Bulinus truncatus]